MKILILAFSTHLLSCSRGAGGYLFGSRNIKKAKHSFFPNLIDYSKFMEEKKVEVIKFKNDNHLNSDVVIGHIGRFMEAKNHMFILDIMQALTVKNQNIKLLLVGDGHLRSQIEDAARNKRVYDKICFAGIQDDIPMVLQAMDAFVFPSKYEGLGLVLLEAQASGLPCLVSDAIQPEADLQLGLVSKLSLHDSPDTWANTLLELVDKKEKDLIKIRYGFEHQGYSMSAGLSKLIEIYEKQTEGS